ncbi:hypothetical protein CDAR_385571 [Caerostris darwini]|uniref:Uncharacterized protein n=1 Tax=Caerostris darwini TaxID=1538125 RepID=A0AAV4M4G3_9ARAC|nr:hypothetical protein CDAR_385571 [Caerostris darwini]
MKYYLLRDLARSCKLLAHVVMYLINLLILSHRRDACFTHVNLEQKTGDEGEHYYLRKGFARVCELSVHVTIYLNSLLRHIGDMSVLVRHEQIKGDEGQICVPIHHEQITDDEVKQYLLRRVLPRS